MYLNIWGGEKVKTALTFDWPFPSDRRGAAASAGSWWCGWTTGRRASYIYSSPSPCFWRGWGLSWGSSVVSTTRSKTSVLTLVIRENNSRDCTCSLKITCDRNCDVLSLIIFLSNFCKKYMCKWTSCKMN